MAMAIASMIAPLFKEDLLWKVPTHLGGKVQVEILRVST
jgi:hypothetical protein